ncbi:peptide/nickel transport system permease protein [Thermotomaculum hydrothermale]|uniref:Peptide/nickel transport system permease protein n=1 Tax=Thermotomaculum hydrothermale TaxID=981385 RepID=A0A7R6PIV2_9BACT|nr:ABC transporter permease [Thermotomaculum hydrothermale]BBB33414.1 peptide/nickel transport system permease protein [Thermotomaculum hydrothermale]
MKRGIYRFLFFSILAFCVVGFLLKPDYYSVDLSSRLFSPSFSHPFGTDYLGRDLLSRVCLGGLISFSISFIAVLISLVVGFTVAFFASVKGGFIDKMLVSLIDIFQSFPGMLLAIVFAAFFKGGIWGVIIALSVSGWVGFARLSRGLIVSKLNEDYFIYSIASGERVLKAVIKHIIPNIKTPLLVQILLSFAGAIIVEASLSFLGIGIKPPLPSWGNIIADGKEFILVAPYISVIPGVFLTLSVLCIKNFLKID